MKNFSLLIPIFFSTFIFGCSTVKVNSDYDPAVSFTRLKSYDWLSDVPAKTGDTRIDGNTLLHNRIKNAINKQLNIKGFQKTSSQPDFWVTYHVTLDKQTKIRTLNNYNNYGPGWGWGYRRAYPSFSGSETYVYTYDQGSLIVDIVAPESRQLIWRGSATDRVNLSNSPEKKEQKINDAVEKLLNQFPPQKQP